MTTFDTYPNGFLDGENDEPLVLPTRRRASRLTLALGFAVACAAVFLAGVAVQKHWGASSSAARGAAPLAPTQSRTSSSTSKTATGPAAMGGMTAGTVRAIKGATLYVTDTSGNTVKVTTSKSSTVTKTVSASVKAISPGDTVVVRGSTAKNGTVAAQSISLGGSLGFGGGTSSSSSSSSGATGFGGGN